MTPKDKAIELYIKYIDAYNDRNLQVSEYNFAKQCVLIAVDEILSDRMPFEHSSVEYWQDVKKEIENL